MWGMNFSAAFLVQECISRTQVLLRISLPKHRLCNPSPKCMILAHSEGDGTSYFMKVFINACKAMLEISITVMQDTHI